MKNIELTNNHCELCSAVHCIDLKANQGRQVTTSRGVRVDSTPIIRCRLYENTEAKEEERKL